MAVAYVIGEFLVPDHPYTIYLDRSHRLGVVHDGAQGPAGAGDDYQPGYAPVTAPRQLRIHRQHHHQQRPAITIDPPRHHEPRLDY
jgi:hypothetical protein